MIHKIQCLRGSRVLCVSLPKAYTKNIEKNGKFISYSTRVSQRSKDSNIPQANGRKLTPQEAKIEAAKLAMSSLKDVGSLFSSGNDDATQPIDTAPIYESHYLFGSLNVIHQGQVVKDLQDKYDQKWTKMNENEKKLGYYIAYGNWGVREKFDNWNALDAPWDLPFKLPSQIRLSNPKPNDQIKKLEPVYLSETAVRKQQFDTKKVDPITKTFIYITAFVIIFALARDKRIGEKGKPAEYVTDDQHVKQRKEQEANTRRELIKEEEIAKARARKWYFLWIK